MHGFGKMERAARPVSAWWTRERVRSRLKPLHFHEKWHTGVMDASIMRQCQRLRCCRSLLSRRPHSTEYLSFIDRRSEIQLCVSTFWIQYYYKTRYSYVYKDIGSLLYFLQNKFVFTKHFQYQMSRKILIWSHTVLLIQIIHCNMYLIRL